MKTTYLDINFRQASLDIIEEANLIIRDFEAQGYTLTLRQLYYQFVSRDAIANNDRSYDRLGSIISKARLAGLVSWSAIEDRNRTCHKPFIENDPSTVLDSIEYGYSPDLWIDQENYVEIWVEKDALVNVIERPAKRWQVPYMACKGYQSSSELWRASNRFRDQEASGKNCHLIHLGDHDPSGIDMTRDNGARLDIFQAAVKVHRVALNYDQIEEYGPPPNPTKMTDSRAEEYVMNYGQSSWELDALQPSVIEQIVDGKIAELVDLNSFDDAQQNKREEREKLSWISENSERVFDFVEREMMDL